MKSVILTILVVGAVMSGVNFGLYHVAYAQGAAEVAPLDAGVGDGLGTSPPTVSEPSDWNPLGWDWAFLFTALFTGLGGLAALFRVVAPRTETKKDDKILGWIEWLMDLLSKLFVPARYRIGGSMGGGKGGNDYPPPVVADNVKFPPQGQV